MKSDLQSIRPEANDSPMEALPGSRKADRYMELLDSVDYAFFELDLEGNLTFVNQPFARNTGYQIHELIGKNYREFTDKSTSKMLRDIYHRAYQTGETKTSVSYEVINRFGRRFYVDSTFSLLSDDVGNIIGFSGIARDASANRQAAIELEKAKEAAETAAKAKSEFLANMSHEIRTPMNAILGFAHLLLKTTLSETQRDYLMMIQESSESLLGIINDILDISKVEAGKLDFETKPFQLLDISDGLLDLFSTKVAEKGIDFAIIVNRDVPGALIGDALRLKQVLTNLISNAVKFTEKGEIIVEAKLVEERLGQATIHFSVRDTGIGMTPDQIQRSFAPFVQGDGSITRQYGGTGLGLTISKRLVEMMGGTLQVDSTPGKGSCFRFTADLNLQPKRPRQALMAPKRLRKKRVLVVDDNREIRKLLRKMLQNMSFQVDTAETGEETLVKITGTEGKSYDLLLIDLVLPGMDGITVAEHIRKDQRLDRLPIILMTGYGQEAERRRAGKAGVNAFLNKPIKQSLLFDTIMETLGETPLKAPCAQPSAREDKVSKTVNGVRVLLVEDNVINRKVAVSILKDRDMVVTSAANGREALEAFRKSIFDLVLMDVHMPEMDGYTTAREIRTTLGLKEMPIVAMTADAMKGTREKCIAAGMNDYITKPIDTKRLFEMLSRWIPCKPKLQAIPIQKTYWETEKSQFPKMLPGINLEDGLHRLENDQLLYGTLLVEFWCKYKEVSQELRELLHLNEIQKARHLVHTIKGVAGNISAETLHQAAALLERHFIKSRPEENLSQLLDNFDKALNLVLESTGNLKLSIVGTADEALDETREPVLPNPSAAAPFLLQLNGFLREGDPEAGSCLSHIKKFLAGSLFQTELDQLEQNVSNYDFENAQMILAGVARSLNVIL